MVIPVRGFSRGEDQGMNVTQDNPATKRPVPTGWIIAVALVLLAWVGAYALRGGGEKAVIPGWQDGMPAGQAAANEKGRPMIVLFTAGWCPPCQALKKNVLTKAEVQDALQAGFVPVQIDLTDQSPQNPNIAVAQQYGVSGIPTVVAMSADGQPIESYRGKHTAEGFNAWLSRLASD